MWVNYNEVDGLDFTPLHPFEFDCIRNKKGKLEVVILSYPDSTITNQASGRYDTQDGINQKISSFQGDQSEITNSYAIWTKDQHVLINAKIKMDVNRKNQISIEYQELEGNSKNINPLGILPFVYCSKSDGGNTQDYPVINPITRQTIFYNILKSDELSAASLQGYGIRVISATSEILNQMEELHEGLTTAIELVQPDDTTLPRTELDFKRPGPDLTGQRESYDSYLMQVLGQHGINGTSAISGEIQEHSSGLDRMLANSDVQKIIKKNQTIFSNVEKQCFEIIKKHTMFIREFSFNEQSKLSITYEKPKMLLSDSEKLANLEKRLNLGLIKKHQALMEINPNLSEVDAIKELDEIEQEKNMKKDKGSETIQEWQ
jgi:hypothetical protein